VIFVLGTLSMLWLLHRYQSKKERAKITKFFGDNEEFARYAHAQDEEPDQVYVDDIGFCPYSRKTNIVYLTTPDYLKSQSLCTNRSVSSRSSSFTNIFNGGSPRNSTPSTAVNSPSALRNNTLNQK
jgi:hypothetical protein